MCWVTFTLTIKFEFCAFGICGARRVYLNKSWLWKAIAAGVISAVYSYLLQTAKMIKPFDGFYLIYVHMLTCKRFSFYHRQATNFVHVDQFPSR